MGDFHVYDPNEVSIVVCGIPITGGFAEDTFIEISQDSNDFDDVVGADGDVTRSKTNDRRATITLTLMQSSEANALLSALSNIDRKQSNGAGVGPLMIKDNQGTALFAGEKSWIAKPPDAAFAKKAGPRAWTIRVADLERFDGGN
jgi:hypothetical protein